MKNSLENKAKFFAQYWGQYVGMFESNGQYLRVKVDKISIDTFDFLELKPLSQISDEDLQVVDFPRNLFKKFIIEDDQQENLRISYVDYLRLKGYALDWNGITVEEMIEFGWIKLKKA